MRIFVLLLPVLFCGASLCRAKADEAARQRIAGQTGHSLALPAQPGNVVQKGQADAGHYFKIAAENDITPAPQRADAALDTAKPPVAATAAADPALLRAQRLIMARGVARIDARSIRALRTAALHGNPVAQYDLGFCYQNGFGVAADRVQAYVWYRRAMNTTAPASLVDAASTQVRVLEAQLSRAQLDTAQAMVTAPSRSNPRHRHTSRVPKPVR